MKYDPSKERSVEFLRLALPLLSRPNAALHPVFYAVWYDYVSGRNVALAERLKKLTENDSRLSEEETQELYGGFFIAELDEETAQLVSVELQPVTHRIRRSGSLAGEEAADFGATLSRWVSELPAAARAMIQEEALQQIVGFTARIQDTLVELKGRLDESQAEIEALRANPWRNLPVGAIACTKSPFALGPSPLTAARDHAKCAGSRAHRRHESAILAPDRDHLSQCEARSNAARTG